MHVNEYEDMLCPIAGMTCPGISNCAPAIYRAVQENDDRLECPIVSALQSLGMLSMYHSTMLSELYASQEVDKTEDATIHLTPDEAARMRVLEKLGVTQDGAGA